jgi:hypothetical protein
MLKRHRVAHDRHEHGHQLRIAEQSRAFPRDDVSVPGHLAVREDDTAIFTSTGSRFAGTSLTETIKTSPWR